MHFRYCTFKICISHFVFYIRYQIANNLMPQKDLYWAWIPGSNTLL